MDPGASPEAAPVPGNPVIPGWFADPELRIFGERWYLYPTTSLPYDQQTSFTCWSSPDLRTWTNHGRILDLADVPWSTNRAGWAPSAIAANGRYHLYFSAGDGVGIGVAVAAQPTGPFADALGRPLVSAWPHGAQPIDAFAFIDDDGAAWLYFGGRGHCVAARLGADLVSIAGSFHDVTPPGYVEGVCLAKRAGRYYLMWSEGDWGTADYRAAYAVGDSPLGPFAKVGCLLRGDPERGSGAGHHTVANVPGTDDWYIAYHRRPSGHTDPNHRVCCIDRLHFRPDGTIAPVMITATGVAPRRLGASSRRP